MKKENTVCTYPWNSVYIDGSVKVCCNSLKDLLTDSGELSTIDDLNSMRDSDSWNSLRTNLLNGIQDPICERCWKMEPTSFRQTQNNWFPETYNKILETNSVDHMPLETITLAIGNHCNLNCRMCEPGASSRIHKEWERETPHPLGRTSNLRPDLIVSDSSTDEVKSKIFLNDPRFLNFIENNSSELKDIYVFGGEPFIILEEHLKFLQVLVDSGNAKNIKIRYSTNGTNINLRRFTDLWSNFKEVHIQVSCDGMEEVYDYIRWPSTWSKMKDNLKYYAELNKKDTMFISVACTMQLLTLETADKFEKYIKDNYDLGIYYIPVDFPGEFSLKTVPQEVLTTVYSKSTNNQLKNIVKGYINSYHMEDSVHEYNNMLKVVKWQDEYRDQKLLDFYPQIDSWFKDHPGRDNYND
jgi:hypothetical protein